MPKPEMQAERFDRFTQDLSQALGGRDSRSPWAVVRALAWTIGRFRARSTHDPAFDWERGASAEETTLRRRRYIKSRTADDIPSVRIRPRQFLDRLDWQSRAEFLALMTEEQQRAFMNARTSRDFFNLLTPDQRAKLVVDFSPAFADSPSAGRRVISKRDLEAALDVGPPTPPPATAFRKTPPPRAEIRRRRNPRVTPAHGGVTHVDACRIAGLDKRTCYYSYQATLETDRDGAPCTYGPFPCGSGIPPTPPGRPFESPFCPDPIADLYGCGALANTVTNVTSCPRDPSKKGVPLEHICNATDNVNCSYANVSSATFTSVVTDCDYDSSLPPQPTPCVIDSYIDPVTGDKISVPVKTDSQGCSPCIQQSGPGACGGVDCPCPGLYISQSGLRNPAWTAAAMNPDNYVNALFIPFVSVTKSAYKGCGLSNGMFVVASTTYDAQSNPTENPADWVAGVLADTGGHHLGEVSYAMRAALGMPADSTKVSFRIYPQVKVGWPVSRDALDALKNKYLGVCCPGTIDDQCHAAEQRGACVTDPADPNVGTCRCTNDWLPGLDGDCTWHCPGSDGSVWVGLTTDSSFQECDGHGHCRYNGPDQNGDHIGECECDDGWFGLLGNTCAYRDCVKVDDWFDINVPPCYGHGACHRGPSLNSLGTCVCDDGWSNGADNSQYCSEATCQHNCSDHGTCFRDPLGNPICICDIEHGWYGADCSQQGCVTDDGRICSGNGSCRLDDNGNPFCACLDEWGGGAQTGPAACSTRQCQGCPAGVASCTHDWNWKEVFCLCICGDNCGHRWTCHCNDEALKPPSCTTKNCCSGFWGECNFGMHAQGVAGGGTCGNNGVCQCFDNYDPLTCCAEPLPGSDTPSGFGRACVGASSRTITLSCSGQALPCSACPGGEVSHVWTLHPDGGGNFHDDAGNHYRLNEALCNMTITSYGPSTYGGQCNKKPDPAFWLNIVGNGGVGRSGLLCPFDCSDCTDSILCTLTVQ